MKKQLTEKVTAEYDVFQDKTFVCLYDENMKAFIEDFYKDDDKETVKKGLMFCGLSEQDAEKASDEFKKLFV